MGASLYGGRFNPPGVPAVYASQNISLALLEILVHMDRTQLPLDYVVMAIRFDDALIHSRSTEPSRPVHTMPVAQFKRLFYRRPVLRAPSVIVPRESNFVLFPQAPDFQASIAWIEPLDFDQRLFAHLEPE